ncbi:KpsF/GutQ family sugar-phosphate isomerase [Cetobacterium somerae]|uniref:KpsF/GutQ family sugar-phosphate isomerase n=1 Tax=Cetobacterium TaxID=180162 RepID=UPI001F0681CE|nr:KpsF/GutQ family sugar-phosphate isomerase [Cetobacterium somerae]MCX3068304.1 KpsF/GutQ family sugar-phosphate isomerase [Cetobacterium somerae]UPO97014.1 KpsF/GutQ family sugar-phosphate isomerase [Cetobacterium somerae]
MDIKKIAQDLFDKEICELEKVKGKISDSLEIVVNLILNSKGKVVITGIGKSGIIGKKIAATLASTGTLAVFMNSAEGLHGDLGMINKNDIVIAISNSGNSDEVISIIPSIKKIGATLIAMTGNSNSRLGKEADAILDIGVEKEGCPLNLAPMSSTTSTLVMGDALATVLITARNFKPENFAVYHPGGSLGRRLLMKVRDVMHKDLPIAQLTSDMDTVIMTMTKKRLGVVCIVENDELLGIITEGDIRRALKMKDKFFTLKAEDIMTRDYTYATENIMALDALDLMENRESQISVLPVLSDKKIVGVVRIHDLLNVIGK